MTHDERSGLAVGNVRVIGGVVGLWALRALTHGVQLVMERAEAPIYKLFAGKAR